MRRPGKLWPPALHWPSIRGRARADAAPLALAAAVVALASFLVGAVPPLVRSTADTAVRDAVRSAGRDAYIMGDAVWEPDYSESGRVRDPDVADKVADIRDVAGRSIGPGLQPVMRLPIATVNSTTLKVIEANAPLTVQLAYIAPDPEAGTNPTVTWLAGGPPQGAVAAPNERITVPYGGPPWPVQIGLSESAAEVLGVRPGAHIALRDIRGNDVDVEVSGIFRPTDEQDPVWQLAPWLLNPLNGLDGEGTTRLGGLLSRESLPDARLAFLDEDLRCVIWFAPKPDAFTWESLPSQAAAVVSLKANAADIRQGGGAYYGVTEFRTLLDTVLGKVRAEVDVANAQASLLLAAVIVTAGLVLFLAAELLIRRRAPALAAATQRGASLTTLGAELLIESTVVAVSAAAIGLALARVVGPGPAWGWALLIIVVAAAAAPATGAVAAGRATAGKRIPANRLARQWINRTALLRRAAVEGAVVLGAVAALVALHQRGILPAPSGDGSGSSTGGSGDGALPASAGALGALAGALLVRRLLPYSTRLALKGVLRSRRPVAPFAAARAAATSGRVLSVVALVTSAALASFALTIDSTARAGLVDGAWQTVGADARVDLAPVGTTPMLSAAVLVDQVAAEHGVEHAVAATVREQMHMGHESTIIDSRLVVVDAAAFRRLRGSTPLPDAPDLERLATAGPGDAAPPRELAALVRSSDGSLRPGMRLELLRSDAPTISLVAVGVAPLVGDADTVVIVDAAAAAAAGLEGVPNTIWATGPGAERAASTVAARQDPEALLAHAVLRSQLLEERRAAPLTSGLLTLALICAAIILALGLVGFVLAAATTFPERWHTLSRLRTLGLRSRETRWVAAGELLPPSLFAAIAGPLLGFVLARLVIGPLALNVLTVQTSDPVLVMPWLGLGMVAVALLVAVAVVAPVESALGRRRRLGDVLRAGGG